MGELGWPAIASIVYFSFYFLLLTSLAYYVHKTGEYKDKKSFLMAIWKKKGIYGQILLHLYDTATDCGVLVEWYLLAEKEKNGDNVESLDMSALFWTSIAFIILYRLVSTLIGCLGANEMYWRDSDNTKAWMCFDGFLGLIDMYVIKAVYIAIDDNEEEATPKQKMIQLGEAIVESLPQIVLQSVYIIRGQNDPIIQKNSSLYLVGFSLLASLLSITNKFIWVDGECVNEGKEAEWSKPPCFRNEKKTENKGDTATAKNRDQRGCFDDFIDDWYNDQFLCIDKWYLLRVIWRFTYIVTRFSILSLIWSVLGGAFIGIFLAISWFMWFMLFEIPLMIKNVKEANEYDSSV